ncbi:DUF4349 domain-containing protein [Pedobacter duraquae]|uniref:Uncharacterized protein DUF4349 n=1 Tax=Pedobacter duraquae TaxID=425511 RepID=A0A4R6II43_9SPHI|nr:DUF4349 domain-containing protein [Pedobacter duraquae]TDO21607.1 uncharacterized protein DUF4349 [Pedobacter duraquae]
MKKLLLCAFAAVSIIACNSNKESKMDSADVSANEIAVTSADTAASKIVKTADMRFRVKDVQSTKEKLSAAIRAEGGTLMEFNVESVVRREEKVKYSADSLLQLTSYTREGTVVAQVPSAQLDEFTDKVVKLAAFVDRQSLKLDDQSLQYLSNNLKNQNKAAAVGQMNANAAKKSKDIATTQDIKDAAVDSRIHNMYIDKAVKYSTITLSFYQDNTVSRSVVENDELSDFRPAFWSRMTLNIANGWSIFMEFILLLANLWVWILLGIAGYFLYRQLTKKALQK